MNLDSHSTKDKHKSQYLPSIVGRGLLNPSVDGPRLTGNASQLVASPLYNYTIPGETQHTCLPTPDRIPWQTKVWTPPKSTLVDHWVLLGLFTDSEMTLKQLQGTWSTLWNLQAAQWIGEPFSNECDVNLCQATGLRIFAAWLVWESSAQFSFYCLLGEGGV